MRIALVHSYYSSRVPSGENVVVDAQAAVLREAGHEVRVIARRTDDHLARRTHPLEAAWTAATQRGPSPDDELRAFAPDVTHLHNTFPNFGRSWVRRWPGPLVATLHNYRPLCPVDTLFRDGHVCFDCPTARSTRSAVEHGCYHDSRLHTIPMALGTRFERDPVLERADVVTTLSQGMSDIFAAQGVPAEKLVVLENFVTRREPLKVSTELDQPAGDYWLFAGRILATKGLHQLIADWPAGERLLVAGTIDQGGPLPAHPDVEELGFVEPRRLRALMAGARGLVFPSVWLEGLALVCLEALSVGTPILTYDDTPAGRSVTDLGVGLAARRGEVAAMVARALETFPGLRDHCRQVFEREFTPQAWLAKAEAIYARASR
jgi:glycosyltransferase involved in cell wall biosynthesis